MLPRCDGCTVHALGITSARRSALCEHLPTLAESGLPGYEVINWLGIVAPRATPSPAIAALSSAVDTVLNGDALRSALLTAGVTPGGGGPREFGAFMARELERWQPVVARFRAFDAAAA